MPRAAFNTLSLEIPDGWEDASLITLLGPEPPSQRALTTRQVPSERPNLVMKRAQVSGTLPDLESFARLQEQAMAELAPGVEVKERGTLTIPSTANGTCAGGTGGAAGQAGPSELTALTRVFAIPTPTNVTGQLQIYLRHGGNFYILCGTCLYDANFKAHQERFLSVARSLRFG